jgi:hypothetical protein
MIKILSVLLLLTSTYAGEYTNRVLRATDNYKDNLSRKHLYGDRFRSKITKDGRLACARVVQILLKEAELPEFQKPLYAVRQIQEITKDWETIGYDDIELGDIIFWRKTFHDKKCSGGGDCHVGIATGQNRSLNNNGVWKKPITTFIKGRLTWRFMYAKRMR